MTSRVVLVPGVLALLPEYAGLDDPVAELRAACLDAVAWLGEDVEIVADPQGRRVAEHLLKTVLETGAEHLPRPPSGPSYLVVGNGSARRSEKAPGHLDERAFGFDEQLGAALRAGRPGDADLALAAELLASVDGIARLDGLLTAVPEAVVDYDDDPYGVQYWVMRWECAS